MKYEPENKEYVQKVIIKCEVENKGAGLEGHGCFDFWPSVLCTTCK